MATSAVQSVICRCTSRYIEVQVHILVQVDKYKVFIMDKYNKIIQLNSILVHLGPLFMCKGSAMCIAVQVHIKSTK